MISAPIRIHEKQIEALEDRTRFRYILAGRRGGKSMLMLEDMLESLPDCPDGGEIFYIGPTNQMAKELIWEPLCARLDELGWKYHPRTSKSVIHLSRNRKIYVIGAEKIRRIRGHKVYRAYLDELAYFTTNLKEVWKAVRPALADLRGKAILATTPNGKATQAYDFYIDILKLKDWKFHHWTSLDNPYIDPAEIEAAKAEMDIKAFNQEWNATWESFEGLAYYNFEETLHIKPCAEFDFSLPIGMAFDFNVNPTSLLLVQDHGGTHRWKKEYSIKNSSTIATLRNFCEDFKEKKTQMRLEVYGDASGNSRKSQTGRSDYHYIREMLQAEGFNFQMKVLGANPAIIDRVAWANAALKNVYGQARVEIDPSCSDLIRDLSSQELEGRFPSDKNNLGHKADAFGYYHSWKQIVGTRRPQGSTQL